MLEVSIDSVQQQVNTFWGVYCEVHIFSREFTSFSTQVTSTVAPLWDSLYLSPSS